MRDSIDPLAGVALLRRNATETLPDRCSTPHPLRPPGPALRTTGPGAAYKACEGARSILDAHRETEGCKGLDVPCCWRTPPPHATRPTQHHAKKAGAEAPKAQVYGRCFRHHRHRKRAADRNPPGATGEGQRGSRRVVGEWKSSRPRTRRRAETPAQKTPSQERDCLCCGRTLVSPRSNACNPFCCSRGVRAE